ncbi:MAG: HPr family phosphocarrier protein [Oscillospiraceae bacterium]|nr:HPr family phosphocarrier protein [Oscillospiraceae bacterium]
MKTFDYTIKDALGLHARPAGMLVQVAKAYESEITITKGEKTISCAKLIMIMSMGVKCGDTVTITINGADEDAAEKGMKEFFEANL